MEVEGDHINNICSLTGSTLGEIFKKFNLYLKEKDKELSGIVELLVSSFEPTNSLQKMFKAKMILKYKIPAEVEKMLLSGDTFYICQALQCPWFFTYIDNPSEFVSQTMPQFSYTTRMKVLKLYSRYMSDPACAERVFDEVRNRYGLSTAFVLLLACGEKHVEKVLFESHTGLPCGLLIKLYSKYPSAVTNYLQFLLNYQKEHKRTYRNINLDNNGRLFEKIASKDSKLFLSMFITYESQMPYIQLGRKVTKRLIKINVNLLMEHYSKFSRIFNLKYFAMNLNLKQIEELQNTLFPTSVTKFFKSDLRDSFLKVCSHLTENEQREIVQRNFTKTFGKSLSVDEYHSVIPIKLIQYLSVTEKTKWIELKIATEDNPSKQAELISRLPIHNSVDQLKQLLSKQSDASVRGAIFKCMFQSIKHHGAVSYLKPLMKHIVDRCRNEQIKVKERIFEGLKTLDNLLVDLQVEDWEPIIDFVNISKLNDELRSLKYYVDFILSKQIRNYLKLNLPTEALLRNYIDFQIKMNQNFTYDLCEGSEHERKCLEMFVAIFPEIKWNDEKRAANQTTRLFISINNFNMRNKTKNIIPPEWLVTKVEDIIKEDDCYQRVMVLRSLKKNSALRSRLLLKLFPSHCECDVTLFILKKCPTKIVENVAVITIEGLNRPMFKEFVPFFSQSKYYDFLGLPQKIVSICVDVLEKEISDEDSYGGHQLLSCARPNAAHALSILLPWEQFSNIIDKYKPVSGRVDEISPETCSLYSIQKSIIMSFKFVITPFKVIDAIKSYAVGDYVKFNVGPICSICLKIGEKDILIILTKWFDSPVSLRKHFIRVYGKIAPVDQTKQVLTDMFLMEKNRSIRKVLFDFMFNRFCSEPNEETFSLIKSLFEQVTEDDGDVFELFFSPSIPTEFIPYYLEILWDSLTRKEGKAFSAKFKRIIETALSDHVINHLSDTFSKQILDYIFSVLDPSPVSAAFIANYLICCTSPETQINRLTQVNQYINKWLENNAWNQFDFYSRNVFPKRSLIINLVDELCQRTRSSKFLDVSVLLKEFQNSLLTIGSEADFLHELIRLEYAAHLIKSCDTDEVEPLSVAHFITRTIDKYSKLYGYSILKPLRLATAHESRKNLFRVCELLLLSENPSELTQLFVLKILPRSVQDDTEVAIFSNIVSALLKSSFTSVRVSSNQFFSNLSSQAVK